MINYIIHFIVYTLAMCAVLMIGFIVYKKTITNSPLKKNSALKIVDMLNLPDRKILYIIECCNEKFLIASSNDKVSFISKINDKKPVLENRQNENEPTENPRNRGNLKSLLKDLSDKNQLKRGNL